MKQLFKLALLFVAVISFCAFIDRQPANKADHPIEKKYALTDADINTIYIAVTECKDITPNQRDTVLSHIVPFYNQFKQAELKDSTKNK